MAGVRSHIQKFAWQNDSMASQPPSLDEIDYQIIEALQADGRQSLRTLARVIGLSAAATTARVHSLEDQEVIMGYQAVIDPSKIGRGTKALIRVTSASSTTKAVKLIEQVAREHPAVRSIFRTLGDCDQVLFVEATDLEELDALVDDLGRYCATNTAMVVEHRRHPVSP